jgi:hypothetical protein
MAKHHSTNSDPASQTAVAELAERLVRHAGNIHNTAAKAVGDDMRAAARVVRRRWVGVYEAIQSMEGDGIRAGLTNLVEGV